ncbi:hypothetical protein Vretimale_4038 [Volvox reticuliferus]|uniref:Uncharacterized protein n=1 Tax=Volvox reticuliferus TaxID=1737510 RepID=A0A8J4C3S5_9CHLO|nr:hypothetical protein Vretifemale_1596 [Volvox reticuliferus]GIL98651.1 hypothetical protein Vretimale_4038 [Volvox reticuliferus]
MDPLSAIIIRVLWNGNFQARPRPRRTSFVQALLLVATTLATTSSAQPQAGDSGDEGNHRAGFSTVLQYMTYSLMFASTLQLSISLIALLQMPRPHCLCYNEPFSDEARCYGTPGCVCANIRQLSAMFVLLWSLLLMCKLAIGYVYKKEWVGRPLTGGVDGVLSAALGVMPMRRTPCGLDPPGNCAALQHFGGKAATNRTFASNKFTGM